MDDNQTNQNQINPLTGQPQSNQQVNEQPVGAQFVGGGSPEAPATAPAAEKPAEKVEFGYEAIKRIESNAEEDLSKIEHKENQPTQPANIVPPQQKPQNPQVVKPLVPTQAPSAIRISGYRIANQLANNIEYIRNQKGKGSAKQSRTWVVMLLDRLLKKQSYSK